MVKQKPKINGISDAQVIMVPRTLERVYLSEGFKRFVPFNPHFGGWNLEIVGQLADQASRCLKHMEKLLATRTSESKVVSKELKELGGMVKNISTKNTNFRSANFQCDLLKVS